MTWKSFSGIVLVALYAVIMRILSEFNILEINSYSFLLVVPCVMSFIPFFLKDSFLYSRVWRAILFPLIAVILFLSIAVISKLEDLLCFAIIGIPYVLLSITISIILREIFRKKEVKNTKKAYSILLLPLVFGMIEREIDKAPTELTVSNIIKIERSTKEIFPQLLSVPSLSSSTHTNWLNRLGVPFPLKSKYNPKTNIRLGYFSDGIFLVETVVLQKENKKLVFNIELEKSDFRKNITLSHVLNQKIIEFKNIEYQLTSLSENSSKVKLSTAISLNSNLSWYGKIWSKWILDGFEQQLLVSLKEKIEGSLE